MCMDYKLNTKYFSIFLILIAFVLLSWYIIVDKIIYAINNDCLLETVTIIITFNTFEAVICLSVFYLYRNGLLENSFLE